MSYESKLKSLSILLILLVAGTILLPFSSMLVNEQQELTLLWSRTWGGTDEDSAWDVAVEDDVYIVGTTASLEEGEGDAFLIKYDADGNLLWNVTWGGPGIDAGLDVAVDGDIYVTGVTRYTEVPGQAAFLARYDVDGNLLWDTTWIGVKGAVGSGVAVDGSDIYIVGQTGSSSSEVGDVFLARYDVDGNLIWNRTWGGTEDDHARGVAVEGDIYVVGTTSSFGAERINAFLVKYDVHGNLLWNRTWEGTDIDSGSPGDSLGVHYLWTAPSESQRKPSRLPSTALESSS